jgi:hypothetical protein
VRPLIVLVVLATATTARAEPRTGFTATAGGGLNVETGFVELQLGRRFARASFFEAYLDYSYDRPISAFSFQTFGIGVRTYFARFDRLELFHQASAAFAISSAGTATAPDRMLGDRLLGPVFTQGIGIATTIRCWTAALVVSTGDPVWLRPEVAVRYTF